MLLVKLQEAKMAISTVTEVYEVPIRDLVDKIARILGKRMKGDAVYGLKDPLSPVKSDMSCSIQTLMLREK
jgi:hypothetical protein